MRWKGGRRSQNVEDRRGTRMRRGAAVGGVGGLGFLIIVVLYMLLGGDPAQLVEQLPQPGGPSASTTTGPPPARQEELADFVSVVLADTEDTWSDPIFAAIGRQYGNRSWCCSPTGAVRRAARRAPRWARSTVPRTASSISIPASTTNSARRFGAPGDFAQAYVIAHEVGHHVQNLLGINDGVQAMQRRVSKDTRRPMNCRCASNSRRIVSPGVWGYYADRSRRHARGRAISSRPCAPRARR